MKTKALQNLDSAQLLINNRQFTTSVHCSYYAVLQYMKYVLANFGDNQITIESQNINKGESSHEFIIKEIKTLIISTRNSNEGRIFAEDVHLLKRQRVSADYSTIIFTDEESLDCKQLADNLIRKLKTYFEKL